MVCGAHKLPWLSNLSPDVEFRPPTTPSLRSIFAGVIGVAPLRLLIDEAANSTIPPPPLLFGLLAPLATQRLPLVSKVIPIGQFTAFLLPSSTMAASGTGTLTPRPAATRVRKL